MEQRLTIVLTVRAATVFFPRSSFTNNAINRPKFVAFGKLSNRIVSGHVYVTYWQGFCRYFLKNEVVCKPGRPINNFEKVGPGWMSQYSFRR